ncbi:MAG TPA: glucoamylase family protein, partial [Pyrinomonadaceae bacterium]|nr:glucoamylase family protein [Pyrinomonadaceae bacterium]
PPEYEGSAEGAKSDRSFRARGTLHHVQGRRARFAQHSPLAITFRAFGACVFHSPNLSVAAKLNPKSFPDEKLETLQRLTFDYFLKETNTQNGLVPDSTREGTVCSITATGFALAAYPVGIERGFITRNQGIERTLTTLRFFWNSAHGPEPDATGYKGFYYHFLDMNTGRRTWNSELSTIDSTFLIAGALTAAEYFDRDDENESEIRALAHKIYERADWQWAQNQEDTVTHGWRPESGFIKYRWEGYNEALILYVLGLASPTYPLPGESYQAWTRTYKWKKLYGQEWLSAGPLFIHQLSHMWIDFRGIQDEYMRSRGLDYFENSRRATYIQQQYSIRNPRGFRGYGEYIWGLTASDGPGPASLRIDGKLRKFYDYRARGVPHGPDDGTLAPWAVIASLPFAPEIVLPSIQYFDEKFPEMTSQYGFKCSFNPTFLSGSGEEWISKGYYGLDQGPIVLMVENFRSEFVWTLMRHSQHLRNGLRRAGFSGGWLSDDE